MAGGHSKAFENLVTEGDNDIVGLLAYALLKQTIREEAMQGSQLNGAFKNPSNVVVAHYRKSAERVLDEFATQVIDDARSEIQTSAILNQLIATEVNLSSTISSATGPVRAIWTNIAAWGITGFIVFLIVVIIASNQTAGRMYDKLVHGLSNPVITEKLNSTEEPAAQ